MQGFARIRIAALCACLLGMMGACGARASAAPKSAANPASTIVLPEHVVAGAQATLAVLDAGGHLVAGAVVQLSSGGEVTTDATGRAVFTAPAEPGELSAHGKDENAAFHTTVVSPAKPAPGADAAGGAAAAGIRFPRLIELGNRFAISGSGFRGDAAFDRVLVGGENALVLASSPVSLVSLLGPRTAIGPVSIAVEVGGRQLGSQTVSVVSLSVTGPTSPLAAGKQGFLTVRVSGSEEPVVVEVRNLSPGVIRMSDGDATQVTTGGGEMNTARIRIEGIVPGDYAVSATVATGRAGLPKAGNAQGK